MGQATTGRDGDTLRCKKFYGRSGDHTRAAKLGSSALSLPEVAHLLKAVRGDRLEVLVILALTTTMGPAELLGLRRRDVNLNEGYLLVTGDLVATSRTA